MRKSPADDSWVMPGEDGNEESSLSWSDGETKGNSLNNNNSTRFDTEMNKFTFMTRSGVRLSQLDLLTHANQGVRSPF